MFHIVRHAPGGAERDYGGARLPEPFEAIAMQWPADEIAGHILEYRKKESWMPDDSRQQGGEFAPRFRRRPDRLPRRGGTRRVQILRADLIETDRAKLLAIGAEPAKPYASAAAVETLGLQINLERYALQAGRTAKMIEVAEEILDFEPKDRLSRPVAGLRHRGARHGDRRSPAAAG